MHHSQQHYTASVCRLKEIEIRLKQKGHEVLEERLNAHLNIVPLPSIYSGSSTLRLWVHNNETKRQPASTTLLTIGIAHIDSKHLRSIIPQTVRCPDEAEVQQEPPRQEHLNLVRLCRCRIRLAGCLESFFSWASAQPLPWLTCCGLVCDACCAKDRFVHARRGTGAAALTGCWRVYGCR